MVYISRAAARAGWRLVWRGGPEGVALRLILLASQIATVGRGEGPGLVLEKGIIPGCEWPFGLKKPRALALSLRRRGNVSGRDPLVDFAKRNKAPPDASPRKIASSHVEPLATANSVPVGV